MEKQINLVMCPWTLESDYQDLKVSLTTSQMFASEIILHIVQSPNASRFLTCKKEMVIIVPVRLGGSENWLTDLKNIDWASTIIQPPL